MLIVLLGFLKIQTNNKIIIRMLYIKLIDYRKDIFENTPADPY
jgi:hypothetical protein